MPHDKNGELVAVGDLVTIEFVVTAVHMSEDFCNVNLESVEGMPPSGTKTSLGAVNTRQTVKVGTRNRTSPYAEK